MITAWNVLPLPAVDLDNGPCHAAVKCHGVLDVEAPDLVGIQLPPASHRGDDAFPVVAWAVPAAMALIRPIAEAEQDRRRCVVTHVGLCISVGHRTS